MTATDEGSAGGGGTDPWADLLSAKGSAHDEAAVEDDGDETDGEDAEEELEPDDVVAALIGDLPAEAAAKAALGSQTVRELNGYWLSASDRVVAAEQLLWQDPAAGVDVVLALVADVDLDDEHRLRVIRLAAELGPAVRVAAAWLLDRIDYAFLEGSYRVQAATEVCSAHPGGDWWPPAYALIARNPHLDLEHRAEAAATLVGTTSGRAAYLALPRWFSMRDLPGALHTANERGSSWAWALLRQLATDPDLDVAVRVDAAEWLTGDPDASDTLGEEVLLSVLEDGFADPLIRARAWSWLDGNRDTVDAVDELVSRPDRAARWPLQPGCRHPGAHYLGFYGVALADAIQASSRHHEARLNRVLGRPSGSV